jgi:hypothetical protein
MTWDADFTAQLEEAVTALDVAEVEWLPAPGDVVGGLVEGFDYISLNNGSTIPIVRLIQQDGTIVKVGAGRSVLARKLKDQKVQAGDGLAVKYFGEAEPRNGGRKFHDYAVKVVRVGERRPDEAFKGIDDDLGLTSGALDTFGSGAFDD